MLWAAFVSFIGGVALFKSAQYLPYLTILSGLFLLLGFYKNKNKKTLFIPLIVAGALYAAYRHQPPPAFSGKKNIEASITGYASAPVRGRYGFSQYFHVLNLFPLRPEDQNAKIPPIEDVRIFTQIPLSPERQYRVKARLSLPSPRLNPGHSAPMPGAEVHRVIACGAAPFPERLRNRLNEYLEKNFPRPEAGFLMSITTGERAMLDWRVRRSFSRCGLAHLISIAGMHFGIFSLSIFFLVRILLRLLPLKWLERLTLRISPKQLAALAAFPLLSGYLLLSGMRIPALRAFIMISFFLLGFLIGRKRAWQATLAFAAFLLVLWRPDVIFDLSFELSFLSVLLIGLFASKGISFRNRDGLSPNNDVENEAEERGKIKKYFIRVLFLSFSITAGLMPLIAFYFHRVQLISPAANIAVVPVAGFLLVPVAVLSGFVYLVTGWYPFPFLSGWLASASIHLAGFFSSLPYVCPPVPAFPIAFLFIFYGFLSAWLFTGKRAYAALSLLPFVIWGGVYLCKEFHFLKGPGLSITFLDEGTGESAVVELPDGKTAVIDTGENGRETSDYLEYMGKTRIDYLILSHAGRSHTGGASYLSNHYKIGEIWDNGMMTPDEDIFGGIPERKLSRGQYIEGPAAPSRAALPGHPLLSGKIKAGPGPYRITVLHPYAGFFPLRGPLSRAIDNSSLVLKIEDGWGRSALFTGDIEQDAQEDLLRLGGLLRCDLYKVPRHGSDASALRPFTDAVHPEIAVISGEGVSRPGFLGPGEKTMQALSESGARIIETGTDGALKADFDEKGIRIKTWKEEELKKNPEGVHEELHNLRMLFSSW